MDIWASTVRRVAVQMGQRLAIMADVPGPKIRIGHRFEWLDLECYE